MLNRTYTFYADSGHAWLKVSLTDIKALGLNLKSFSEFSYFNNCKYEAFLYLEEDCDADIFISAYQDKFGKQIKIRESHSNWSKIRNFNRMG